MDWSAWAPFLPLWARRSAARAERRPVGDMSAALVAGTGRLLRVRGPRGNKRSRVNVRLVMAALVAVLAGCSPMSPSGSRPPMDQRRVAPIVNRLDHLVFAVANLDDGIAQLEAATGVRAQFGGAHPGQGSHNALLALGPRVYLEIVAPDPAQANPRSLASLGLSETRSSRMVGWALEAPDLDGLIAEAGAKGFPMAGPTSGERQRPDGYLLSWRIATLADQRIGDGLAPFFIDWGATEHPTVGSPTGVQLVDLRAQYPAPQPVQAAFDALGIPLRVEGGAEPALIATLDTPRGRIELR